MLVELRVRNLGVIEDTVVELGPGMTALTGETGAGKTLIVDAVELLLGGRADSGLVRPGAEETLVEGRFLVGDEELILTRAVPASGRGRAWVDGRMAPLSALTETGGRLVDLHGQHAHQSLLQPAAQRRALDAFAGIDLEPLRQAEQRLRALDAELHALGGDERARARETDLLRYQLADIEQAAITDPDEDSRLAAEAELLAGAAARRQAAATVNALLDGADGDGFGAGVVDRLGEASAQLAGDPVLAPLAERLLALQAEAADVAAELRASAERFEDDPERQEQVRLRRQQLHDLQRKYGDTLADVIGFGEEVRRRLSELDSLDERAGQLQQAREAAAAELAARRAEVGAARRAAAPRLAAQVQQRLRQLAMSQAQLAVEVGADDPGDDVVLLLGANPGEPAAPLARVASGGELARAMLALRLVLTEAPPTMVFDEVDAGIGGEAAGAVGRALAEVAVDHQVLVVTHLAQVAACADRQLVVTKAVAKGRTTSRVDAVTEEQRVVELARMLSGQPHSDAARRHAEELLGAGRR